MSGQPGTAEAGGTMTDFERGCAELLQGEEVLAAARGITREQLEGLFQFCYDRYLNGEYELAARGFGLLCMYDHVTADNWQGYGYSLLALKDYPKAAAGLAYAGMLLKEGSVAWADVYLHLAKALIHAGQDEQALSVLQALLAGSKDSRIDTEAEELSRVLEGRLGRVAAAG